MYFLRSHSWNRDLLYNGIEGREEVKDVLKPIFGLNQRVEIAKKGGEGHAEINVLGVYWFREAAAALSYDVPR